MTPTISTINVIPILIFCSRINSPPTTHANPENGKLIVPEAPFDTHQPDHIHSIIATPQGLSPTGTVATTLIDSVSTTLTSFDGPFAV